MSSIWRKIGQKTSKEQDGGRCGAPPTVPGYVTEELIGQGAASEVWAARCARTGEQVALKRLRGSASHQDLQRLRAEAGLLASFSHPNVIGLRGVRSDDAGLVLVLERAARSLTELLGAHGVLRADRLVGVLAPLAEALGHAHTRGILHGDISPGNILLRADGVPLLADLGTARLLALCGGSSSPVAGSGVYGTPGFIDPALEHGEPFGPASDVYALAAVAACALVGERLDDASDAVQSWANRAHQLGVPPALAVAICAVLVSPRAGRPAAGRFAATLQSACPAVALQPAEVMAVGSSTAAYDIGDDPMVGRGDATRQVYFSDHGSSAPSAKVERRSRFGLARLEASGKRRAHRKLRRLRLATLRRTYGTESYFAAAASRQRRRIMLRGGTVLALIVGIGLGSGLAVTALGGDAAPPATSRSLASRAPVDVTADHWRDVLDYLDSARARAFTTLDATLLEGVYAPTSPMLRADQAQLARLQRSGTIATGLRHRFRAVHVVRQTEDEVLVQASEQLQAHRIVPRTASGHDGVGAEPVLTVPVSTPRTVQISLITVHGQWRIDTVTPV